MAKISALSQLTATQGTADKIPIVDNSATETKYINPDDLHGASTALDHSIITDGASGFGINFGSATLHDYIESGSFTPTLYGVTTPGNHTYDTQYGFYTRIGNCVFFTIFIEILTLDTISGGIRIGGLPLTAAAAAAGGNSAINIARVADIAEEGWISGWVQAATTYIALRDEKTTPASIQDTDLGTNPEIMLSGHYFV